MKKKLKTLLYIIISVCLMCVFSSVASAADYATDLYGIDFENNKIPQRLTFATENGDKETPVSIQKVDGNNVLKFDTKKSVTATLRLGGYSDNSDIELKREGGVYELEYRLRYFRTGTSMYPYFAAISVSNGYNLYMNIIREWASMRSTMTYATNLNYPSDYNTAETNKKAGNAWYKIKIVIDTVNNTAKYYVDGRYIGMQNNLYFGDNSYKSGIQSIKFVFRPGDTGEAVLYLDDITIRKYNSISQFSAHNMKVYGDDGDTLDIVGDILPDNTVTARTALVNPTEKYLDAVVSIATYNKGVLSAVTSKNVSAPPGTSVQDVDVVVQNITDLEVKAFAWDENLAPLSKMRTFGLYVKDSLYKTQCGFDEDDETGGFDEIYGNCKRIVDDGGINGVFAYPANAYRNAYAIKKLDGHISDGIVRIGFDYKTTGYINKFWIRTLGNGSPVNLFYDGGTITHFPNVTNWTRSDSGVAHSLNKWQRVDVYIDLDKRVVYYYINQKLYASTVLDDSVTSIYRVQFQNEGSYNDIMLDNVVIAKIKADSVSLPSEVRQDALVRIHSDNVGRIFFDKDNIDFKLTLKNKLRENKNYTLKYYIIRNGLEVGAESCNVSVQAGEEKTLGLTLGTDGYGYSNLCAELYDEAENLVTKAIDYKFSVANVPVENTKNNKLGIQITTSSELDKNDMHTDLYLMKKLRFSMVRGSGISFSSVDENGVLSLSSWTEEWFKACRDSGMNYVNILAYGNSKITSENPPRSEAALEAFAKYAVDYCDTYKRIYGYAPEYVDVWNEYWMEGSSFNIDRATPEDYAAMLRAVDKALSKEYPDTKIMGLSGVGFDNIEWTRRVLAAGGGEYIDILTLHPYSNRKAPEEADVVGLVNEYKKMFESYNLSDKKIYASEWGWPSVGNSGYPGEEEQAAYFVRANVLSDAYNLFDKIIWYGSNDVGNSNEQEKRFGLIRGAYASVPYEAKPIYFAAANYMKHMTGAEFIDTCASSEDVEAYRYKLSNGKQAVVIWLSGEEKQITLGLNATDVTLIDINGNEQPLNGAANKYTVTAQMSPCYVIGDFTAVTLQ